MRVSQRSRLLFLAVVVALCAVVVTAQFPFMNGFPWNNNNFNRFRNNNNNRWGDTPSATTDSFDSHHHADYDSLSHSDPVEAAIAREVNRYRDRLRNRLRPNNRNRPNNNHNGLREPFLNGNTHNHNNNNNGWSNAAVLPSPASPFYNSIASNPASYSTTLPVRPASSGLSSSSGGMPTPDLNNPRWVGA